MKPIELSEITNIADYELERRALRPRMIALKDRRRVRVGEHLTFLFENRETVRYQIQEMMRIERIVDLAAIRHEVETYNELIPPAGGLSACLLIEYAEAEERDRKLREMLGLEDHVWLAVAGLAPSKAVFDGRQIASDRVSAVQYIRFELTAEQRARWREGVRMVVDHPGYLAETPLSADQLAELGRDFES
ncbi:MAG TPA: DUF3501 family protein [Bryobacteraceae bacterium]|nr:DUF3501 family protein [Bryobacteraceae bacterium]